MRTSDELEAVHVVEFGCYLVAKQPPGPTRGHGPSSNVFRVGPNQVTESAFMRNLLGTGNDTDLIEGANLRAQATVYAKNFAVNDCSEDKEVEDLTACLPNRSVPIFLLALFVETVDLSNLTRLVVAADEGDTIRVSSSAVSSRP